MQPQRQRVFVFKSKLSQSIKHPQRMIKVIGELHEQYKIFNELQSTLQQKKEIMQTYIKGFIRIEEAFIGEQRRMPQVRKDRQQIEKDFLLSQLQLKKMIQKQWIGLQTKANVKIRSPHFIHFSIQLSYWKFNVFFPVFLALHQDASIFIKGFKEKLFVKIKGPMGCQFKQQFEDFINILILQSNIEMIMHQNTDERHHSKLYQKLDVLQNIVHTLTLHQSSQGQAQQWHIKRSFLSQIRREVAGRRLNLNELLQIPKQFRKRRKQSTSQYIQIHRNLTFIDCLVLIPQPQGEIQQFQQGIPYYEKLPFENATQREEDQIRNTMFEEPKENANEIIITESQLEECYRDSP